MVVTTLNASGGAVVGTEDGTGGAGLPIGVPEKILHNQGNPHENIESLAGSSLCEDVTNHNLYMADRGDSGSSWIRLVSGT